jgi:hypothetical protein
VNGVDQFPLTEEHRMLLRIRDTLYEGIWEDFVRDLRARAEHRPHVFETVADSPAMKPTIENHLKMIDAMRSWELEHGRTLTPCPTADTSE